MKLLVLLAIIVCLSTQIKWDQIVVNNNARGKYSQIQKYWTGGLIQCDNQCVSKGGYVCGTNERFCCKDKSSCTSNFGMTVCRKLDKTFECALNDGSSPFKLKQTFPPNAFPQVTDLYD